MTGHEYVQLHAPFYPGFDMEMMESSINTFKVDQSSALQELSYGQQKKFMISFALASNTNVLLMDEPTNGLDIPSKSQFRKIVASLDYSDRCIVISTHQVRDLGAMIDQVSIIKNGEIVFNHSLDEIQKTLRFETLPHDTDQEYLYTEETLGGIEAISSTKKYDGKETGRLDLELLFNGIIAHTNSFQDEFKTTAQ
jgi:ABC-2 type transport system ATP-binding protein